MFNPTEAKGPYLDTFYQLVYNELTNMCKTETFKPHHSLANLTPQERQASLAQNSNIIIKPTGKGGGIVLQNRSDYLLEAKLLLSDSNT